MTRSKRAANFSAARRQVIERKAKKRLPTHANNAQQRGQREPQPAREQVSQLGSRPGFRAEPVAKPRLLTESAPLHNVDSNALVRRESGAVVKATSQPRNGSPQAAESYPAVKLCILAPSVGESMGSLSSPIFSEFLGLIQQQCAVQIENGALSSNSLTVQGTSLSSVRAAEKSIYKAMLAASAQSRHEVLMIEPSHSEHGIVVLTQDADFPGRARFTSDRKPHGIPLEESGGLCQPGLQAAAFRAHFDKLSSTFLYAPANIDMRVNFGRLLMTANQDRADTEYAAAQLDAMLNKSAVGKDVRFFRNIGGRHEFEAFQQEVCQADDAFYPCSSAIENIAKVPARKFLVFATEIFHFEVEIGPPCSAPDGRSAQLSHLRVFQTLGSDGTASMAVACPENCTDWKLEAQPELKTDEIPMSIITFLRGVTVEYSEADTKFPAPKIDTALLQAFRIKQMLGRLNWTVGCTGSRYQLELLRYHVFPKPGSAASQQVLASISLSNSTWGETLKAPSVAGRARSLGKNLDKLFRPQGSSDGVIVFLQLIHRVDRLWGAACSKTKVLKTKTPSGPAPHQNQPEASEDPSIRIKATGTPSKGGEGSKDNRPGNRADSGDYVPDDEDLITFD